MREASGEAAAIGKQATSDHFHTQTVAPSARKSEAFHLHNHNMVLFPSHKSSENTSLSEAAAMGLELRWLLMLNGASTSVFYQLRSPLKPSGQRLVDILCACCSLLHRPQPFSGMAFVMFVLLNINNSNWGPFVLTFRALKL